MVRRVRVAILALAEAERGHDHGARRPDRVQEPVDNPVGPADITATIYSLLGIDPATRIRDRLDRPHTVSDGTPIAGVMA